MLRDLAEFSGWYLGRDDLVEEVLGEAHWLFCQGVLELAGALALRCQRTTCKALPNGITGYRQQCGAFATRAPDGASLCVAHLRELWCCCQCNALLPTGAGDCWSACPCLGYVQYCGTCAADEPGCED